LCTDDEVIGTAFYVMEMVEGRIFWDATFPQVSRENRPLYFDAMNETLAWLHGVDYMGIGLSDYGRPATTWSGRSRDLGRSIRPTWRKRAASPTSSA
jgi:aminoglycoside phosphotransferase (APT) family kinase protein